ncbi:hypothetical protein LN42_06695 [Marinitoga sp. 1137]|uniref:O-antigen ligase family protein n=1 Tax=Marinitoga sp. 1137 TaxID=1545835 RepID=UPI0009506E80|nr:O-antigen ligase family protein [Marinitoga sp. 1137]APT76102.1 hypothetical protein LN42_06695 [Marinitoga sp. 1137]
MIFNLKDIVLLSFHFGFLFSFFNIVPAYPIFIVLGIVFLILYVYIPEKLVFSRTNKLFYIIGFFYFSSALISGVKLSEFFSYNNFRHDGNFYITYMPLFLPFLHGYFRSKINYKQLLIKIYVFISFITLLLTLSFLLNHPIGISADGIYHYLFKAHNAAGGYYLMISLFGLFLFFEKKSFFYGFLFVSNAVALYFTKSRGSLLAFLWVMGLLIIDFLFKNKKLKKAYYILTIIGSILIISGAYYLSKEHGVYNLQPTNAEVFDLNNPNRTANISDRLFVLWPRAIDDFLRSPLFGIGFTRYNDLPYRFIGIEHIFMINTSKVFFSDAHAHNSFLHILAETGIIGFIFLILLLKELFFIAKKIPDKFFSQYVYYSIFAIMIAGLTEHRIYTPAQVMPFTIILEIIIYIYYNQIYAEDEIDEN